MHPSIILQLTALLTTTLSLPLTANPVVRPNQYSEMRTPHHTRFPMTISGIEGWKAGNGGKGKRDVVSYRSRQEREKEAFVKEEEGNGVAEDVVFDGESERESARDRHMMDSLLFILGFVPAADGRGGLSK